MPVTKAKVHRGSAQLAPKKRPGSDAAAASDAVVSAIGTITDGGQVRGPRRDAASRRRVIDVE
jgi:hypothetical protein